jgi:photosystem II stability/assembly factor-like uncharacterized protein
MRITIIFITSLIVVLLAFTAKIDAQWVLCPDSISIVDAGDYPSISVIDANTAIVVGGAYGLPAIYRTTNGGNNFAAISTSGISLDLTCVWAKNINTIFVGDGGNPGGSTGGNAKVYRTTNGGVSWQMILSTGGNAGYINGIVFSRTNPNLGVIQSDPPSGAGTPYWVATTIDGGNNWTLTAPPGLTGAKSSKNSLVFIDNLLYGFGLNTGTSRIYITTNGGTNWNVKALGITGGYISALAFSTGKNYGIAASSNSLPNISRSIDGGANFNVLNIGIGVTGYCTMKWIHGTSTCYLSSFSGTSGCIRKSTDNGVTWTTMTTPGINGITHMEFVYSGGIVYAYAIAKQGVIYKVTKLVDNITGTANSNTQIPSQYALKQNYPNPFNPTTTIEYALPVSSMVTIKIYDMLGNEVMDVVNEYKNEGIHSVIVNGTSLASGLYFYTIKADKFVDTKKMVLLK